jgi:uncharacterized circularly permuted ATP-grasp superfamily protein
LLCLPVMKILFLLSILLSGGRNLASASGFDEMYNSKGQLRPAYTNWLKGEKTTVSDFSERHRHLMLGAPLGDAIKILPIPLILPSSQTRSIARGSRQRGLALRALYEDLIFNDGKIATAAGLIDTNELKFLLSSESGHSPRFLKGLWQERKDRNVSFFMGPDIMRESSGQFRVIEDNVGPIGGIGDVDAIHKAMFGDRRPTPEFLRSSVLSFLDGIPKESWSERVIALVDSTSDVPSTKQTEADDNEDIRRNVILRDLGIPLKLIDDLKSEDSQLMGEITSGKVERIINFSDPLQYQLPPEKYLELFTYFSKSDLRFMTSPGVEILGSKALLPKIEDLIRLYLKEEPILNTQDSTRVTTEDDLKFDESGWVYKMVNENQGKGVYLIDALPESNQKATKRYLRNVLNWIKIHKEHDEPWIIRQRMIDSSYLSLGEPKSWLRFSVDIRPLTFVSGDVKIPNVALWGRAVLKSQGAKNNVSISAMELVITNPENCEDLLERRL